MRRNAALAVVLAACVTVVAAAATAPAQTPNPVPPAVTTGAASNVGLTTATVAGKVDPNTSATTYRVEYGTSTGYGLSSSERSAGDGDAPLDVSVALGGLTSATTYHYRVVATNAAGIARGADRTLKTTAPPNPPPPVVVTGAFAELVPTGATVTGSVNPRGSSTTYRFEWGTGTSLNRRTATQNAGAGAGPIAVNTRLRLTPATRYSYRIVATNAAGTARGARRTFTTPAEVRTMAIELSSRRVVYGDGVDVIGRLRGTGTRNLQVALELQQFPFSGPFHQVGAVKRVAADGTVRFGVPTLVISSRLRLVTRSAIVTTSRAPTVRTAVRPGLRVRRLRDRRLRFSGAVRPGVPGATVSLQRRKRGRFLTLRRTTVQPVAGAPSRYRITLRARRRGAVYRVVVVPPSDSGHVRNGSRELFVRGAAG